MQRKLLQLSVARILVTGAAGFIGFHSALSISRRLGHEVVALDSLNPAIPTPLTNSRVKILNKNGIEIVEIDLTKTNNSELNHKIGDIDLILHLAAFPGVRVTKSQEERAFKNNLLSFETVTDYTLFKSTRLIYASSSSVYGDNGLFSACKESDLEVFQGKGSYAQSKWENERKAMLLMRTHGLRSVGLRLFSVYGEYGREDMAYYKFANHFLQNQPIHVYGSLEDLRDYTPIKLVVDDILQLSELFLTDSSVINIEFNDKSSNPVLNIGSGSPRTLLEIIEFYEKYFGKKANLIEENRLPMESRKTWSNNEKRDKILLPREKLDFESTLLDFLTWFEEFNKNV